MELAAPTTEDTQEQHKTHALKCSFDRAPGIMCRTYNGFQIDPSTRKQCISEMSDRTASVDSAKKSAKKGTSVSELERVQLLSYELVES